MEEAEHQIFVLFYPRCLSDKQSNRQLQNYRSYFLSSCTCMYILYSILSLPILSFLFLYVRYLQPPAYWLSCGRDSQELLSLCVSKLHGMNKVRLVNAEFVWTEPHSKRLKLKLTVQKEVVYTFVHV